ncbi:MAG: hypothetical protein ACUZ8E_11680 [Candidatus Anammoxibacter sp.]
MTTLSNKIASKLELHYFFSDESHQMDAIVKNKCESELLAIIKEVSSLFGIDIVVEAEALVDGGLIERFSFLSPNKHLPGFVIGVLTIVLSSYLTTDKELVELQKQELTLKIEKLKRELNETSEQNSLKIENPIFIINNYKIIKHRSTFYNSLISYPKVTKLSTKGISVDNEPTDKPRVVERNIFEKFILNSDDLEPEIDENARIEIISPVLKAGDFKWKGLYKTESINFYMKDKEFKKSVVQEGVPFKNGAIIDCVLEISKKLNELGDITISGYSVTTVIRMHDEDVSIETPQGKKYKRNKQAEKNQFILFDPNDYK